MKNRITHVLLIIALASCGGSPASSPVSPVQIPTSIEYAGGEVSGDIAVQMGKSLNFNVKDEDGTVMTDLTGVSLIFTDGESGETVSDGSCGSYEIVDGQAVYTAPTDWPNVPSKCSISGSYNGDALADISAAKDIVSPDEALSGTYEVIVTIEPTIAATNLVFETLPVVTGASGPDFAIDEDGALYVCYRDVETDPSIPEPIYFIKSIDKGASWSSPIEVASGVGWNDYSCAIEVLGDNVVIVYRHNGTRDVDDTSDNVVRSTDGGVTFGPTLTVLEVTAGNAKPQVVIDSNNIAHVISTSGTTKSVIECSATSCGTAAQITATAASDADPRVAIAGDDTISVVYRDTQYNSTYSDVYISQIASDGTISAGVRITDSTANDAYVLSPTVVVDRDGAPVIAWAYMGLTDSFFSNVFTSTFNPDTGEASEAVQINDNDPSDISAVVEQFVDASGFINSMYMSYGSGFDHGIVRYTIEDGVGGFIASKEEDITGWVYDRTTMNVRVGNAGWPSFIWDVRTYVDGTLTDSYILIAVGRMQ